MRRRLLPALLLLAGALVALAEDAPTVRSKLQEIAKRSDWNGLLVASDRAIAASPEDAVGWEFRSYALHKMNRLTEARDGYARVVAIDAKHAWAWTQLGWLQLEMGKPEEAKAALDKALELDHGSIDAYRKLVTVHRQLRDWDEAYRLVLAADDAELDPKWSVIEGAYITWARGEPDKALEWIARAEKAKVDPDHCAWLRRAAEADRARSAETMRRCANRAGAQAWTFQVGAVEVETRVGAELPPDLARELKAAAKRFPEMLGAAPLKPGEVKILLARTIEEHEDDRRRAFPGGKVGRAYTDRNQGGPGGRGRFGQCTIHAAYARPQLERTLRHELVHAILYRDATQMLPSWLDEGVATWLETWEEGTQRGACREELLDALAAARRGNRLLPLHKIVALQGPSLEGADGVLRYAECWSFVHYLAEDACKDGPQRLRRLLEDRRVMGQAEAALNAVYDQDLATLEKGWRAATEKLLEGR